MDAACPLAHLDMVGTAEFEALKDTEKPPSRQEKPMKSGAAKPKPGGPKASARECADCGRMQMSGRVDPADGNWYCNGCWESMTVQKQPGKPLRCQECKKMKTSGDYDPGDGQWYCSDCWAAF